MAKNTSLLIMQFDILTQVKLTIFRLKKCDAVLGQFELY